VAARRTEGSSSDIPVDFLPSDAIARRCVSRGLQRSLAACHGKQAPALSSNCRPQSDSHRLPIQRHSRVNSSTFDPLE